jgi:hypothetical protein
METIYFVNGEFLNAKQLYPGVAPELVDSAATPLLPLFAGLGSAGLDRLYKDRGLISQILVGVRDFRPPEGLGLVHYDAAYVIDLSVSTDLRLKRIFRRPPVATLSSQPVWRWEFPGSKDDKVPWTFFIAQASRQQLLVTTDLELLRTLEGQWKGKVRPRMPDRLEWAILATNGPLWAVRRYRHAAKHKQAAGLSTGLFEIDARAVAVTFSLDLRGKKATMGYVNGLREDGFIGYWRGQKNVAVAKGKDGSWELSFPVSDESDFPRLDLCLTILGFGLYL